MLALDVHLIPDSVVVRKECFYEVGIFNRRLAGIDDWDMWTRIAAVRPVLVDPVPVCVYRVAAPKSGQGSSALGQHLYAAIKHQTPPDSHLWIMTEGAPAFLRFEGPLYSGPIWRVDLTTPPCWSDCKKDER